MDPGVVGSIGIEDLVLFNGSEGSLLELIEHCGGGVFRRYPEVLFVGMELAGVHVEAREGEIGIGEACVGFEVGGMQLDELDAEFDDGEEEKLFHLMEVFPVGPDAELLHEGGEGFKRGGKRVVGIFLAVECGEHFL